MCTQHLLVTNDSHPVGIFLLLCSEMVLQALSATA
jgi:hypothetical protein